jgi:hypothetical protein
MDALVKWWFIFWSCIVGAAFVQSFGLFEALWYADHVKLSFVIISIFVASTVFIGLLTRRLAKMKQAAIEHIEANLPMCWFSTEAMNALGMIGTVAGFLIMLSSAFGTTIDPANTEAMKRLISAAAIGLSTSACATLVGLVCATLGKLQIVVLEKAIDDVKRQSTSSSSKPE